MYGRDGVDDFYEPFFNWPALYRLGGADDLLTAAKRHWEGITSQMTAFGFVRDEYEVGYDWFHQGESLSLFLGICAADPADLLFRTLLVVAASSHHSRRAGTRIDRGVDRAPPSLSGARCRPEIGRAQP